MPTSWRDKSFEQLPALSVRGRTLRSSLRTVTAAWMFGIAWSACITGSQMTSFCRLLGFSNYDFGILAAIPFAATLGQLYAASIIERTGLRKYMFIYYATVHRLLWLVIAVLPLLVRPGRLAVAMFLMIVGVSSLLAHLSTPPWWDWMASIVPRRIRGRYFGHRAVRTIPIQMVVVIVVGLILDRLTLPMSKDTPITIANQPYLLGAICVIFAVGAVLGTIDILLFLRLREVVSPALLQGSPPGPRTPPLRAAGQALVEPFGIIRQAFRDRVFAHYALYGAIIAFSISVCDQFFYIHALEQVGFSKLATNFLFMVIGALSSMLMARPWGAAIDRWGRRPVLILSTIGVSLAPFGWFLMIPGQDAGNFVLAMASCLMGGATWSGVNMAQTNVILGFAETSGRTRYIAAAAAVTAVGGLIGGMSGGTIAEWFGALRQQPLHVGPFPWNNYHMTFLTSCAARAGAILLLVGMPDPGARPLGTFVRTLWFNAYSNVTTRLFWPLRSGMLRRFGRRDGQPPADDDDRPAAPDDAARG